MFDLQHLQTFVLVTELGSLAAAARRLRISAAAVSKQLTRLESNLGLQLLTRSTRHVELTEMGKSYCEQCKRILEEVDAAADLVSQMKTIPHGPLKVVSGRHFASSYIVPHIKEFLAVYPRIQLTLELTERIPDLANESIDVLIGMSISAGGDAIQRKIASTRYSFCASPDYLHEFGLPLQPKDLLKHRFITHSMRRPDNELIFSNKERVALVPYLRVNDAESMVAMAKKGLGIVKVHHYLVSDLLQKGILVELLTAYSEGEIPLYVAFPQRRYLSAKTRCFIDFINEKVNNGK